MEKHKTTSPKYSTEVRERADEHPSQWAAITSIAGKIGCAPQTLHAWVSRAERDQGLRIGPTTQDRERL